jgi:hypothetical protein
MRWYDERRRIDVLATVMMPILALAAALLTAFLAGCTGPAYGAKAPPGRFVASAIRFVPDEAVAPDALRLELAGLDLEQNRFALRVLGGIDTDEAADRLVFDPDVARFDHVAVGAAKLHFTALSPGTTRVGLSPDGAARPVGGTLVVE